MTAVSKIECSPRELQDTVAKKSRFEGWKGSGGGPGTAAEDMQGLRRESVRLWMVLHVIWTDSGPCGRWHEDLRTLKNWLGVVTCGVLDREDDTV